MPIDEWFALAKTRPGITIEPLNPLDAIASTQIPGDDFTKTLPRIIIAIAQRYDIDLITCDHKILAYSHVKTIW
jgi:PIN domain nuclease of toxin-antitoxin system